MKKITWIFTIGVFAWGCGAKGTEEVATADSVMYHSDSLMTGVADTTLAAEVVDSLALDNEHAQQEKDDPIDPSTVETPATVVTPNPTQQVEKKKDPEPTDDHLDREQKVDPSQTIQKESQTGVPRKLHYEMLKRGSFVNAPVAIRILLWDNNNLPVRAGKEYKVTISIEALDSKIPTRDTIRIPVGASDVMYRFIPREPGIYKITCDNPEMLPAEWKLNVMGKYGKTGYLINDQQKLFRFASLQPVSPYIFVSVQEDKISLADGEDFAEIGFLLIDPDNLLDDNDSVRVIVTNSKGRLSAREVHANKIDFVYTHLTSTTQGPVTVRFNCVDPGIKFDREFTKINFSAAIDHFELSLAPPEINLFDLCQVIIYLKNKKGVTIATDRIIPGSIAIIKGSGHFAKDTLRIASGQMQAQVPFQPTTAGLVTIRAHLTDLPHQVQEVRVTWPWLLILLASVFGLIGSFGANKRQKTKWITIFIGAITGLAFYWLVLFFLSTIAPKVIILNPISAIVLGTCGGFGGTEILRTILKRFGIEV